MHYRSQTYADGPGNTGPLMQSIKEDFTLKAQLKLVTLATAALCLSAGAVTGASDQVSVTPSQIKDGMTALEFREYGKTSPTTLSTRMGDLEFTEGGFAGGYPTLATVDKLRDELDYQRATQAYIWALPLVSYAEWLKAHEKTFNAKDGDIVLYKSPKAKQGILTANVTTPYAISFADLTRTGPLVFNVPPGPSAGIINDMWQRAIADFGVSGPDGIKGSTYLILAPGMELPEGMPEGKFMVINNPTNIVFLGIRALQPDPAEADAMLRKFNIYPYSERSNNPKSKLIEVDGETPWGQWQPHGMAYWEALKVIMDREAVDPRDRMMMSMLDSLGLRKGEDFNPDERQKALLKEAAVIGEAMAKSLTYDSPFHNTEYYGDTHWDQLLVTSFDDRDTYFDQVFRRAAFTYEAVTRGKAYYIEQPGIGQQYRTGYKDDDGQFLIGSEHYTLTMPPNPPAKIFWSAVVYDVNTRTPIINSDLRAAVSSRTGVVSNDDGSVTIHFGPVVPDGVNKENWIQTNIGESWFTYLRFYGPTEAYFDESYPLQNIKRVK